MLSLKHRIQAFASLRKVITDYLSGTSPDAELTGILGNAVDLSLQHNPWFIKKNVDFALHAIGSQLTEEKLKTWLGNYNIPGQVSGKIPEITVITAGNIPGVGFHDFLCVLMAGARFKGKLSGDDQYLIPAFAEIISRLESGFINRISFTSGFEPNAEILIATGSNNTARYFEYHYGNRPHIFRRNRNGAAILDGNENPKDLRNLATDVFMHFGLGCRNVAKIYAPQEYDFSDFLKASEEYAYVRDHEPYMNNYKYQKALMKMQKIEFIDNGHLLLREAPGLISPVAAVHFEYYQNLGGLAGNLKANKEAIQCVVANADLPLKTIGFGTTQQPGLTDYADDVDTLQFVLDHMI